MDHSVFARLIKFVEKNRKTSIDEIAAHFSVTNDFVEKWFDELNKYDEQLFSYDKGAYSLITPLDLLNKEDIWQQLPIATRQKIAALNIFTTLVSTNEHLRKTPFDANPIICLAEHQSGGRGRRGKSWISPLGRNIYLSLLLRSNTTPRSLGLVSLVTGISIIEALQSFGTNHCEIKWPNDIYWRNKKLAGVLIEAKEVKDEYATLVIGVGLNVHMNHLSGAQIDQAWTALSQVLDFPVSRNQIAAKLIHQIIDKLQVFEQQGFSPFKELWKNYDYLYGKQVSVSGVSQSLTGIAAGINDKGELLLRIDESEHYVTAGEISVRIN